MPLYPGRRKFNGACSIAHNCTTIAPRRLATVVLLMWLMVPAHTFTRLPFCPCIVVWQCTEGHQLRNTRRSQCPGPAVMSGWSPPYTPATLSRLPGVQGDQRPGHTLDCALLSCSEAVYPRIPLPTTPLKCGSVPKDTTAHCPLALWQCT